MNNRILWVVLVLLTSQVVLSAQESALDKVTDETCSCMAEKELDLNNKSKFEEELGLCMITAATPVLEQLGKEEGIDVSDQDALTKVGEKVGAKLALSCPKLFQQMMQIYADQVEVQASAETMTVVEGQFVGLAGEEFASVQLKGSDGEIRKYLWLDNFEGASLLQSGSQDQLGKTIKVYYQEKEFFRPKSGKYEQVKVIQKMEWQ